MFNLIALFQAINPSVIYVASPRVEIVDVQELISLKAEAYGLDAILVSKIIECESRGLIDALNTNTNGSHDRGLLQINTIHDTGELDMLDPEDNLDFGLQMMQKQGTRPWKSSKHCWS